MSDPTSPRPKCSRDSVCRKIGLTNCIILYDTLKINHFIKMHFLVKVHGQRCLSIDKVCKMLGCLKCNYENCIFIRERLYCSCCIVFKQGLAGGGALHCYPFLPPQNRCHLSVRKGLYSTVLQIAETSPHEVKQLKNATYIVESTPRQKDTQTCDEFNNHTLTCTIQTLRDEIILSWSVKTTSHNFTKVDHKQKSIRLQTAFNQVDLI